MKVGMHLQLVMYLLRGVVFEAIEAKMEAASYLT